MKKCMLLLIIMVLVTSLSYAAPILTSDPTLESEVDSCKIDGEGFTLPCIINAERAIYVDLATVARGRSYTVTARFCAQGGLWCSDPSDPFSFTAPNLGSRPTLRLSTQ